jgi:hypothetical protein
MVREHTDSLAPQPPGYTAVPDEVRETVAHPW